jgi:hypothetical protein
VYVYRKLVNDRQYENDHRRCHFHFNHGNDMSIHRSEIYERFWTFLHDFHLCVVIYLYFSYKIQRREKRVCPTCTRRMEGEINLLIIASIAERMKCTTSFLSMINRSRQKLYLYHLILSHRVFFSRKCVRIYQKNRFSYST